MNKFRNNRDGTRRQIASNCGEKLTKLQFFIVRKQIFLKRNTLVLRRVVITVDLSAYIGNTKSGDFKMVQNGLEFIAEISK